MSQPIPKKIKDSNPNAGRKQFTTLLIDGSNLLKISMRDEKMSSEGHYVGGVFQFLLQIKLLLQKGSFRYVYVFWDNEDGYYRWLLNPDYKMNRDKSFQDEEGLSDYMKEYNANLKRMQRYLFNKGGKRKSYNEKSEKEIFIEQREVVMNCLEELFIRQVMCDKVEADDLIAYYVNNKKSEERIVIVSTDQDLTQLISDDVIIYNKRKKMFLNKENHLKELGCLNENIMLKKVICGDTSDNIKGIKGVGEKTLIDNFPQFRERKVTLDEVIEGARKINEERLKGKKKPLKWAENIVNGVTDSTVGSDKVYEVNQKIIDLRHPLMDEEATEMMKAMMYSPLDPDGRSMENLYQLMKVYGIDELTDEGKFSSFFNEFVTIIDREKKNT